MFPTQSKVHRTSRLWLLPVIALAMLLVGYAVFASATAQAQTPVGDVCVEGIVIDWEEKPLAGWVVTLTREISVVSGGITITAFEPLTATSAPAPEDDDPEYKSKKSKKYPYEYPELIPISRRASLSLPRMTSRPLQRLRSPSVVSSPPPSKNAKVGKA
jgi:hypothetical protein